MKVSALWAQPGESRPSYKWNNRYRFFEHGGTRSRVAHIHGIDGTLSILGIYHKPTRRPKRSLYRLPTPPTAVLGASGVDLQLWHHGRALARLTTGIT
jgi:hypothetical protein